MVRSCALFVVTLAALLEATKGFAQGQDSEPYERDILVIEAMLAGLYSNANQSYFDRRVDRAVKHAFLSVEVREDNGVGFAVSANGSAGTSTDFVWRLSTDPDAGSVTLVSTLDGVRDCTLVWSRSAAEFRAQAAGECDGGQPESLVLSESQLWIRFSGEPDGDYRLHRARAFDCYADIPGVGGGRNEPYDRYDGFTLHDQGGSVWFDSKEGRRLGISLLLVDWPINNFDGAFARDSLVMYLSEETDEGRKELGYAFTVPHADRIGLNLKWILVNCFMQSNETVTPFM